MSNAIVKVNELETQFMDAVKRGVDAWKQAGELLVKIDHEDPKAIERIKAKGISQSIINTFLAIGRGQLLPSLVTAPASIRRLPIGDQERIVQGKVEALVIKPDGTTDKVIVDIMRASPDVIKQVVGPDGIRSLSEQKAAIVAKVNNEIATKAAGLAKKNDAPWWLDGKNVVITSGKYSRRDLQTMLNAIL